MVRVAFFYFSENKGGSLEQSISEFVLSSMASGALGNATYDALKQLLGKFWGKLEGLSKINQHDFFISLDEILQDNPNIKEKLIELYLSFQNCDNEITQTDNQVSGSLAAGDFIETDELSSVNSRVSRSKVVQTGNIVSGNMAGGNIIKVKKNG